MFKKILFFLVVLSSSRAFAQKRDTVVIATPSTCNHCKVCETCGLKLETDLYFVRGIKLVTYNEAAMTTTIVYKPKLINPDKIRQEIVKLGFSADNVPADPSAYAKRDNCCRE
jgi:hypothetical protein